MKRLLFSPKHTEAGPAESDERGYIVAQTALLLIPLMIFAAFATDIGYWYVQGQKAQQAVDAAALAGVTLLPDVDAAITEAREVAARNGFTDATPGDNTDFLTGPLPQIEVSTPTPGTLEVKVRREESSFLGRVVLDGIIVERFAIADFVAPLHLGNPSSALGTGTIPQASLGVPSDLVWIAMNSYCTDIERGDHLMAGFTNGIVDRTYNTCGPADGDVAAGAVTNPNHDPDGYVFVAEMAPGSSPIDIDLFEPGAGCTDAPDPNLDTGDSTAAPRIYYRVYGPSTSLNHKSFIDNNTPIATGLFAGDACYTNSPTGDGWWPAANGLAAPGPEGGFYYLQLSVRNPSSPDLDTTDEYWAESGINSFSVRATRSGVNQACIFSAADTTCPKLYALDWLPMFRSLDNTEDEFFLTEVEEGHAGATMQITVFDAADGAQSMQFAGPDGVSVPFSYRYVDRSRMGFTGADYFETSNTPTVDTCSWGATASNPCLLTTPFDNFNDHMLEISIQIPPNYTCGGNCWWTVRYASGGGTGDRTNWSISYVGDPVRLVE